MDFNVKAIKKLHLHKKKKRKRQKSGKIRFCALIF